MTLLSHMLTRFIHAVSLAVQDHASTVGAAGKLVKAAYEVELLLMNAGIYESDSQHG